MFDSINLKKSIIIFLIVIIGYLVIEWYFSTSMNNLPKGEQIKSIESPNGNYLMNIYFIDGGAISANAIRVEVQSIKNLSVKNIYYAYSEDTVNAEWIDNDTVAINNINLNIHKDKYKKTQQ